MILVLTLLGMMFYHLDIFQASDGSQEFSLHKATTIAGWEFACGDGALEPISAYYINSTVPRYAQVSPAAVTFSWTAERPDVVRAFVGTCPTQLRVGFGLVVSPPAESGWWQLQLETPSGIMQTRLVYFAD